MAKMLHMIKSDHIYITLISFHTIHISWNDTGGRIINKDLAIYSAFSTTAMLLLGKHMTKQTGRQKMN